MVSDRKLASLEDSLLKEGLVTKPQMDAAREKQFRSGRPLGSVLVEMGALTENALIGFIRKALGYEQISLVNVRIEPHVLGLIPKAFAIRKRLAPVRFEGDSLILAMEDPSDFNLLEDLRYRLGLSIKPMVAKSAEIDKLLESYPEDKTSRAVARPRSALGRFLSYVAMPVVLVLPFVAVFGLIVQDYSKPVQQAIMKWLTRSFDAGVQFSVLYGIWSIIWWYVLGLVFPPAPSSPEEEKSLFE